ncbi:ABC transporter substrate-binding protein [Rhodoferax sp.]|uniref:MlaC/ttg2D family ABC transporter substrate-binding protein n=1 Tax=Rhodoferax sp. TaxID=50421 RepID=UPI0025CE55B6|nr:ABC transporter substrate-binding protein [Rhodoferax sp.]
MAAPVHAADEAPDVLIDRLTREALDTIQSDKSVQAGNVSRIIELVDEKVMPHVNFQRMTASAVGPGWRQATPEQRTRLEAEFKILLARTYAGAMSQARNLSYSIKPLRAAPDDKEVIVRTLIKGRGDPAQLDYRLEKTPGVGAGWKIYNINVLGVWLVETYRSQFSQEINAKGIDGLITTLTERNKSNAADSATAAKPVKG